MTYAVAVDATPKNNIIMSATDRLMINNFVVHLMSGVAETTISATTFATKPMIATKPKAR